MTGLLIVALQLAACSSQPGDVSFPTSKLHWWLHQGAGYEVTFHHAGLALHNYRPGLSDLWERFSEDSEDFALTSYQPTCLTGAQMSEVADLLALATTLTGHDDGGWSRGCLQIGNADRICTYSLLAADEKGEESDRQQYWNVWCRLYALALFNLPTSTWRYGERHAGCVPRATVVSPHQA